MCFRQIRDQSLVPSRRIVSAFHFSWQIIGTFIKPTHLAVHLHTPMQHSLL